MPTRDIARIHASSGSTGKPTVVACTRAALEARTREVLRSALGLAVVVDIVGPRTLPRSEGKAVRVIDQRRK